MSFLDDPKKLLATRIILGVAFVGWWGYFLYAIFFSELTRIEIYSLSNNAYWEKKYAAISISNCAIPSRFKSCKVYSNDLDLTKNSWTFDKFLVAPHMFLGLTSDVYIKIKDKIKVRVVLKFRDKICYETIIENSNSVPMQFRLTCTPK